MWLEENRLKMTTFCCWLFRRAEKEVANIMGDFNLLYYNTIYDAGRINNKSSLMAQPTESFSLKARN